MKSRNLEETARLAAAPWWARTMRRTIDVAAGVTLSVVTLPVVLGAAVLSAVVLRAWPFFVQERIGLDGRPFRFLKIRTLPVTAPKYTDKHSLKGHDIPRFCRALRDLHIDELPQLYLVVAGQMTLVGPRPEMPFLHERLPSHFAALRTSVRPGCTGLWQVSESCAGLIEDAPEYDCYHLAHRSLRLDAWILLQTVGKLLRPRRRITLQDVPAWAVPAPVTITLGEHADSEATPAYASVPVTAGS